MEIWRSLKKRSNLVRKSAAFARQAPRALARLRATPADWRAAPPLLCNSFPKSGTHLLMQLLEAMPGAVNYGSFIAQSSSFFYRPRPGAIIAGRLDRAAPGEVMGAHLPHDAAYGQVIARRNIAHFFIYRDPRDVVVSNAHYMQARNPWNRVHRHFGQHFPDLSAKLNAIIDGLPPGSAGFDYPDIATRYRPYLEWLKDPSCCCVRYEDLMGPARTTTLHRMTSFFARRRDLETDLDALTQQLNAAIQPDKSHTFRSGGSGEWRHLLSAEQRSRLKALTGQMLMDLGYETDPDW